MKVKDMTAGCKHITVDHAGDIFIDGLNDMYFIHEPILMKIICLLPAIAIFFTFFCLAYGGFVFIKIVYLFPPSRQK